MRRPKIEVTIAVEHPAWRKKWRSLSKDASRLLAVAAAHPDLKTQARGVVALVLTNDRTLRELNRQFRGKDRPTNVLSFEDETEPLGGIAVSYETVAAECQEQGKVFVNHAKHMILHGFLHLLGYDHTTKGGARLMEQIEIAILRDVGIPNPYVIETKSSA